MKSVLREANEFLIVAPRALTELVRGTDQRVITQVTPLLREGSVALDCKHVRRIDAAGIAALISLYGSARQAGHRFGVCNVSPHVAEILALVGLDHILVMQEREVVQTSPNPCVECPAA